MTQNIVKWASKAICELEEARDAFEYIIGEYNTDNVREMLGPYDKLVNAERLLNYIIMQELNVQSIEEGS